MINYKAILTSDANSIKHNYYFLFLINNFFLIKDFDSFKESLFDKRELTDEEKEQFLFILNYLLKTDYILFQLEPNYLERLKEYFLILLKDKQYKKYKKEILKSLQLIKINFKYYKLEDVFNESLKRYKSVYGLDADIKLSNTLFEQLLSSDLLMFNYLFVEQQSLLNIVEENFSKEKINYASSLYHILNVFKIDNFLPLINNKMELFLNQYMENEEDKDTLLFGRKLNILFEKKIQAYKKSNILFLPERNKLVYQSESKNGKILHFRRDT